MADFAYRPGTNPNAPPSSSAAAAAGSGGGGPAGPVSPTGRAFAQRFPVYQIDFTSVASGKKLASTKRRVRWYVHNLLILIQTCGTSRAFWILEWPRIQLTHNIHIDPHHFALPVFYPTQALRFSQ